MQTIRVREVRKNQQALTNKEYSRYFSPKTPPSTNLKSRNQNKERNNEEKHPHKRQRNRRFSFEKYLKIKACYWPKIHI